MVFYQLESIGQDHRTVRSLRPIFSLADRAHGNLALRRQGDGRILYGRYPGESFIEKVAQIFISMVDWSYDC